MPRCVLLALTLVACTEYDLGGPVPPVLVSDNPASLPESWTTDEYVQLTTPKTDVLFVLDNSSSMDAEREQVLANMPAFMTWFLGSSVDWHVGVISTDVEHEEYAGRLREARGVRWLESDTPDPVGTFTEMAPLYSGISHDERGTEATWMAIEVEGDAWNAGFLREDASLHVIVVSDENDHSTYPTTAEFIAWMRSLKPDLEQVSFNAITGPPEPCAASSDPGLIYSEVAAALGGFDLSICEADWAPALDELGLRATSPGVEFYLTERPVLSSLQVEVDDGAPNDLPIEGWTYDEVRNSVTLTSFVPPEFARITIRYRALSE